MATASDYKVTFPFGATTKPYSLAHPHSGEDRPTPIGTSVKVGDDIIGLTGNTGNVTGAHLHVQKMVNGVYVNPEGKGLEYTIAFPARVVEVGNKADVGNFIRVLDVNHVRWSYFHLSEIKCKAGQVIAGREDKVMIEPKTVKSLSADFQVPLTEDQVKYYSKHPGGYQELFQDFLKYNYDSRMTLQRQLDSQTDPKVQAALRLAEAVKELQEL